ncbi:YeeE/YedE thiosulfate transporter family protein [Candidatus Harpocratesius sp.]
MILQSIFTGTAVLILVPILTLILGVIIGYLAQQSGFCSIGGMRDLFLFKQTRLFFGYLALIASAFVSYFIFSLIIETAFPNFYWAAEKGLFTPIPGAPGGLENWAYIILAIIGGFGMGLLGVMLGGCPLRQIVMGFEGSVKSLLFILGMMVGAVLFHLFIASWVVSLF